jgi:hypothetical protein
MITGARTKITKAHLKKAISKICISEDKYFTALCIKTKHKPDIIIMKIAIKEIGILLIIFLNFKLNVLMKFIILPKLKNLHIKKY